jgi:hypothetical protein
MPIPEDDSHEKKTKFKTLPSWIPLLSKSKFGEPENVYSGQKNGDNLVGLFGNPHYKASGDKKYLTTNLLKGELFLNLRVKGFKFAVVKDISARNTGGVILRESLEMGSWKGIKENPNEVPDKLWRTLVADRDPDGHTPPAWYQRACLRCLEIADIFNNGDLNVGELLQLQERSEMVCKYLRRVRDVTWNRRFFTAKTLKDPNEEQEGPLFGLGPPETKEGDSVYILFGCSVPVVLRKVEESDGMKLIGEVYVYEKMEGEAVEKHKRINKGKNKNNIPTEGFYQERDFNLQ